MTDAEKQLLEYLKERALRFGQFTLASKKVSNYFIDGKMVQGYSRSARAIGEVIYEHTKDLAIDALGGQALGAVPLTTAAVIAYDLHGREMEGFWVREEKKDHGTEKKIEGALGEGTRVAILEDVVTTGGSSLKAIEAVRAKGCEVVFVLGLVDRLAGAAERFRENGVKEYRAVFTVRDLGVKE